METHQNDPLGRVLFALTHFRALLSIINYFSCCLFPSIIIDIHIIGPPLILSFDYEYFKIELHAIGFSIQLQNCVAW
jgi:hypothetical protein